MQILVLYFSKGGNTKQLAESIAEGANQVEGAEVLVRSTQEVSQSEFESSDGVIVGSPVYFGIMAAEIKKVLDDFIGSRKKMEGKVGAAFATSGEPTGGKETTMMSIIQSLMIYGMIIVGDPLSATGHYGTACAGAPDEKSTENGRKLGKRVAETAKKLQD